MNDLFYAIFNASSGELVSTGSVVDFDRLAAHLAYTPIGNAQPGADQVWNTQTRQFEPAPPPAPTVPRSVTRRQALQALTLTGLIDSVQPAIDAIADPLQRRLMQIEFDDSQVFERQRPALLALAAGLGLDSAALDQLFITAAKL